MTERSSVYRTLKLKKFTSKMALSTGELSASLKKAIMYGPQSKAVYLETIVSGSVVNSKDGSCK